MKRKVAVIVIAVVVLGVASLLLVEDQSYGPRSSPPGSGMTLESVDCYRNGNVTCTVTVVLSSPVEINGTMAYVSLSEPQSNTSTACGSGSYDGPATFAMTCNISVEAPPKGTAYSGTVVMVNGFAESFTGVFS